MLDTYTLFGVEFNLLDLIMAILLLVRSGCERCL